MGVFDDKKFQQLDWMTQMTETIESDLNDLLSRLPDKISLDKNFILENYKNNYGGAISISQIIRELTKKFKNDISISWEEENILSKCFKFEIVGEIELNTADNTMTGELNMLKITQTLDDDQLQSLMGVKGVDMLRRTNFGFDPPLDRMNEILDLLGGCEENKRNRSVKKKMSGIQHRLLVIFKNNEWRIRDMNLANKICVWIKSYIVDGNLADLTNLCKLKVMTHGNMPIYSVVEEK